ncbi:MAG: cytochrome c3 family protein [Planctomycetes bacterium]|nr:cytochrome c3 family protein [Planctomycetota bacterium]
MALLNPTDPARRTRRLPTPKALAIGLLATVAGCAFFALSDADSGPAFNHKKHAEEGLECDMCHDTVSSEDAPGMPVLDACMQCHSGIDTEETPPEKQPSAFFDADGKLVNPRRTRLSDEVIFSHLRHVNAELDCAACHGDMTESERVDDSVAVSMADCMACHEQSSTPTRQVPNDCATCHSHLGPNGAPQTHDHNWQRRHGQVVRAHTDGLVNQCSLCHTEASCQDCHRDQQPQSHNNYFRLRGHGVHASVDRESCTACHRTDFCDRCHRESVPLSHAGSFGAPRNNHCLGCHEPLRSSSCYTCHKDAPSHRMAPPKPPDHVASMNCRLCHGVGLTLPHVDNGSDCNACHR